MNKLLNKIFYIYPIILLITCCTLIRYNVPIFVHTWPWVLLGCVVSLIIRSSFIMTKPFRWLVVYMLVVMINFFTGDSYYGDIAVVANEFAMPFLACSISAYILTNKRNPEAKTILTTFFFIIIITTICTEIINIEFPGAVRTATTWEGDKENEDMLMAYWRLGMSNYLLPHALPVLIVPCFLGVLLKGKKQNNFLYLIALVSILFLIYLGGNTTAFLLAIMSLLFAFHFRGRLVKPSDVFVTFLIVLPLFVFPDILSPILESIAGLFSGSETGTEYVSHLLDINKYNVSGESGNMSFRLELYGKSLQQFSQNILLGTNSGALGYHSALFDRLGTLGLIGIIPLVGFFVSYYKFMTNLLNEKSKGVFLFCYLIGLIMLTLKNMWNIEVMIVMFSILPVLLFYLDNKLTRKNVNFRPIFRKGTKGEI